jgi:hypothetical protein
LIDEERALELIDQMRISIPEEIEKAARIIAQKERVLAQANEEAARILQMTRQKGEEMLDQETSVQAARGRAQMIIDQALQEAARISTDADNYVVQVLRELETRLLQNINVVRNGINEVVVQTQQNQFVQQQNQSTEDSLLTVVQQPLDVDAEKS